MRTIDQWLSEYAVSHQNPTNKIIHKIFVPLIVMSIMGILWCIPTPRSFGNPNVINWATFITIFVLGFYLALSPKYFLAMSALFSALFWINKLMASHPQFLWISIGIFVVSWVFQFIGHKIEGKKPSFLQDLAFLLIGPLWVAKAVLNLK